MHRAIVTTLPGLLAASSRRFNALSLRSWSPSIHIASSRKGLPPPRALSAAATADKAMAPSPKLAPADLPNPYAHELCAPPMPLHMRTPIC